MRILMFIINLYNPDTNRKWEDKAVKWTSRNCMCPNKILKFYSSSYLRQSISRINIHRGKKLNSIAKKKDDIAKHLEAGNEVNAKIWVSLMNSLSFITPISIYLVK
jgi:hypothetical protein